MGCKMDLTNELRQSGWKPISEIVNEPNYNKDDVADIQLAFIPVNGSKKGKFKITHELHYSSDAELFVPTDDFMGDIYFYRRLIPVLPNQVVISREDATLFCVACDLIVGDFPYDETEMSEIHLVDEYFMVDFYKMAARLRAKLEGK